MVDPNENAKVIPQVSLAAIKGPSQRYLLVKKRATGTWGLPGGHLEPGETVAQAIDRELFEETGIDLETLGYVSDAMLAETTSTGEGIALSCWYSPKLFPISLSEEHSGAGWFKFEDFPENTLPSTFTAIKYLNATTIDIADLLEKGEVLSPVIFEQNAYFTMRGTGTNFSYRHGDTMKYIYRPFEEWMVKKDLFLGAPIVLQHPPGFVYQNYIRKRIIGSCIRSFVQGSDIKVVGRVYDEKIAKFIADNSMCTSPGASFELESETKDAMFEGKAFNVDHLAVVDDGVWNKENTVPRAIDSQGRAIFDFGFEIEG